MAGYLRLSRDPGSMWYYAMDGSGIIYAGLTHDKRLRIWCVFFVERDTERHVSKETACLGLQGALIENLRNLLAERKS